MKKSIGVLDTTLRDGAQSASVSYTVKDKLKILDILDALGIGFAEARRRGEGRRAVFAA